MGGIHTAGLTKDVLLDREFAPIEPPCLKPVFALCINPAYLGTPACAPCRMPF
jgi:hypothetical protein